MKKGLAMFLLMMFAMLLLFVSASAMNEKPSVTLRLPDAVSAADGFALPRELRKVESSAFEGTAVTSLDLPQGLLAVGERAFADTGLKYVFIPDSVRVIGDGAFGNDRTLLVAGTGNGYAREWAQHNGFLFSPVMTLMANTSVGQSASPAADETPQPVVIDQQKTSRMACADDHKRCDIVLLPDKGRAALNVRSRYFP